MKILFFMKICKCWRLFWWRHQI